MKVLLGILLVLLVIHSCIANHDQQRQCLRKSLKEIQSKDDYLIIKSALEDTIRSWVKNEVRLVNNYKNKLHWMVDGIIFNKNQNRIFGWVLEVDTSEGGELDYIKFFVGEKTNEVWQFYYASIPSLVVPRKENLKPYTFKELSEAAINELIEGGYYKSSSCNINYKYIDG